MLNQGIKKPNEVFSLEKFEAYTPGMRLKYIQKLIKEFIEINEGITSTQIEKELCIRYETVVRHLERLEATGEIYKAVYGRTNVYFSNHKNLHPIGTYELDFGNRKYVLGVLRQQSEDLLFIQEKRAEPTGSFSTKGSIIITIKDLGYFFSETREFLNHYKNWRSEK